MNAWEWIFWSSAAIVGYTYVGYPLLLALVSRRGKPIQRGPVPGSPVPGSPVAGSVSILLSARNEETNLPRRLRELVGILQNRPGEIIVVSDGSTDRTAQVVRDLQTPRIRLIELSDNVGKASALSLAAGASTSDFLVFADCRQTWAPDALEKILENFADPSVGAVSGDLVLESAPGVLAGVGAYWKFEKWLRKRESRWRSQVGVTGAIAAVRRELFRPIPDGTLLDDVYWPLQVAMQGHRVIHEEQAKAFDRLPERTRDEFRRKVRTLAGNFQLLTLAPQSLLPWRNPVWWPWISHKLLRLVVPWALLALLACSFLAGGVYYFTCGILQVLAYILAFAGLNGNLARKSRLVATAASFLVLNVAAGMALLVWITGRAGRSWHVSKYHTPATPVGTDSPLAPSGTLRS